MPLVLFNTRGSFVYVNSKLSYTYLTNLSVIADELSVDNSDRYGSFNKLAKKPFTESHRPDI